MQFLCFSLIQTLQARGRLRSIAAPHTISTPTFYGEAKGLMIVFTSSLNFAFAKLSRDLPIISKGYDATTVQNFREMLGLRVCSEA